MFVEEKTQGEVTEAPAKTLKLSEAIRIGARLKPQYTGRFWFSGKSCALGAAYEGAIGPMPEGAEDGDPGDQLTYKSKACQCEALEALRRRFPGMLSDRIYQQNDRGVSREQIADWLEAQGY